MDTELGIRRFIDETVDNLTIGSFVLVLGHHLQQLLIGLSERWYIGCERIFDKNWFIVVDVRNADVDLGLFGTGIVPTAIRRPNFECVATAPLPVKEPVNTKPIGVATIKRNKTKVMACLCRLQI